MSPFFFSLFSASVDEEDLLFEEEDLFLLGVRWVSPLLALLAGVDEDIVYNLKMDGDKLFEKGAQEDILQEVRVL